MERKFLLPQRYAGSQQSVWTEYSQLAAKYNPLNLGAGFPDFPPPKFLTETLKEVADSDNYLHHQYTREFGHPRLVTALAKLYSLLLAKEIDPYSEIVITIGADEALFATINALVDVGDEVIIIEPYYDSYEPLVKNAGGIPIFVPLRPNLNQDTTSSWILEEKELQDAFNTKTKLIILNTPHNPLGKVFTEVELTRISDLCKKWNVVCVSDEVYEWIVYLPNKHVRIATLPGMWERTITIGSAGKTFSVTGWKIGWAYGPANLMVNIQMVHQNCFSVVNTPAQEALAIGFENEFSRLGQEDSYFVTIVKELEGKRDFMTKLLTDIGMKPLVPEGGYFILADWSPLEFQIDLESESGKYKDYRFTRWMIKNLGLQGIPPTAFYSEPNKYLVENFVRYCFSKKDENLQKAAEILRNWKYSKN